MASSEPQAFQIAAIACYVDDMMKEIFDKDKFFTEDELQTMHKEFKNHFYELIGREIEEGFNTVKLLNEVKKRAYEQVEQKMSTELKNNDKIGERLELKSEDKTLQTDSLRTALNEIKEPSSNPAPSTGSPSSSISNDPKRQMFTQVETLYLAYLGERYGNDYLEISRLFNENFPSKQRSRESIENKLRRLRQKN